jgi:hypothetical protein
MPSALFAYFWSASIRHFRKHLGDFDKPSVMRYITGECIPTYLLGLTGT